jgi:hypothetical protein
MSFLNKIFGTATTTERERIFSAIDKDDLFALQEIAAANRDVFNTAAQPSPLAYAVRKKKFPAFMMLLMLGAQVDPLAMKYAYMKKLDKFVLPLFERGARHTLIWEATLQIRLYAENAERIRDEFQKREATNPLTIADIVDIKEGGRLTEEDEQKRFFKAVKKSRMEHIAATLARYPDACNWRNEEEKSPLCVTIEQRNLRVLDFLLDHGGDANEISLNAGRPFTLLHMAAYDDLINIGKSLIRHSADLHKRTDTPYSTHDANGHRHYSTHGILTPRELAIAKGNKTMAAFLQNAEEEAAMAKKTLAAPALSEPTPAPAADGELQEKFNDLSARHAETLELLKDTQRHLNRALDRIDELENRKSLTHLDKPGYKKNRNI